MLYKKKPRTRCEILLVYDGAKPIFGVTAVHRHLGLAPLPREKGGGTLYTRTLWDTKVCVVQLRVPEWELCGLVNIWGAASLPRVPEKPGGEGKEEEEKGVGGVLRIKWGEMAAKERHTEVGVMSINTHP